MRVVSIAAVLLLLVGCNGSTDHSILEGVYSGADTFRSANLPSQPPTVFNEAGAVAPDGTGYFMTIGSTHGGAVVVLKNLLHIGPDQVILGSTKNGLNVQQAKVTAAPGGGYTISLLVGGVDTSNQLVLSSDPVTDAPKPMAELAGSYQGADLAQQSFVAATLDAQGRLQGTEGIGCNISAQLSQVDDENLYTVSFKFGGNSGCALTLNGVAWVGDTDLSGISSGKGTYLNIIAFDDPDAVATGMSLKLQ